MTHHTPEQPDQERERLERESSILDEELDDDSF